MKNKIISEIEKNINHQANCDEIKNNIDINKYCVDNKKNLTIKDKLLLINYRNGFLKIAFFVIILILTIVITIPFLDKTDELDPDKNNLSTVTKVMNRVKKPENKYLNQNFSVNNEYKQALNKFTSDFANKIITDESQIFSPISIYNCFAMLYEGSVNKNQEELEKVFYIDGSFDLSKCVKDVMDYLLVNTDKTLLKSANSVWVDNEYASSVKNTYLDILANDYYAEVYQAQLENSKTHEDIANWINKETNNLLGVKKNAFAHFDEYTIMALINSIYLKATWIGSFDKDSNFMADFYLNDNKVKSQEYMQREIEGYIIKSEKYDLVSIPMNDNVKMNILFPKDNSNNIEIFKNNVNILLNANENYSYSKFVCTMPKFAVEAKYNLVEITTQMGLNNIFKSTYDFSKMIDDNDVAVGSASHAAKIEVNNSGIEAAAYTVIGEADESVSSYELYLNRPFMYSVCMDDIPLFVGTYFGN